MEKDTKDYLRNAIVVMLLFLLGCIMGWIYEMLFYRIDTGAFIKRGQGFGPWLPIYGFGTLIIITATYRLKHDRLAVFAVSTMGAGLVELITGWALFHFGAGLRLWDYNKEIWNWGNIGGYICLRSVLVFGAAGMFLVYILVPFVSKKTSEIKTTTLAAVMLPLTVLFVLDFLYGYIIKPVMQIL